MKSGLAPEQSSSEADLGVSGAMVRRRQDDGERRSPALASGTAPGRQEGSERWPVPGSANDHAETGRLTKLVGSQRIIAENLRRRQP